jgi:two-component system, chemotaxis family, chemotaxis protein CheY
MYFRTAGSHAMQRNEALAPRILVVDDDRLMLTIMTTLIHAEGYLRVDQARDGSEALKKVLLQNPAIVFLDIEMPNLDGIETLRAIMDYGTNIQVVMVSSLPSASRVEAAKKGGAVGFLVKPVSQKRVGDAISTCLKRANQVVGDVELFILS